MAARGVLRQVSIQLRRNPRIYCVASHVAGVNDSSLLPSQTFTASSYLADASTPQSSTVCPNGPGIHGQSRSFTATRDGGIRQLAQVDHALAEGPQPAPPPIDEFDSAISGPESGSAPLPSASEPDTAEESASSKLTSESDSKQLPPSVPRPVSNKQKFAELAKPMDIRTLNSELSRLMGRAAFADTITLYHAWRALPSSEPSVLTYNMLLQSMMRLRRPASDMYDVFAEMKVRGVAPDLTTYNCLMRRMFQLSDFTACDDLMQGIKVDGLTPDATSYNLIISACASVRKVGLAILHHRHMTAAGYHLPPNIRNEFLRACAKTKRTTEAAQILRDTQTEAPPVPIVTADLLNASLEMEDAECALLVLSAAGRQKVHVEQGSLLLCLHLAARTGNTALTEVVWRLLGRLPVAFTLTPPFHSARIHSYASARDTASAFRAVRELEESLVKGGEGREALSPFTTLLPVTRMLSKDATTVDDAYYELLDMHAGGEVVAQSALNCVVAACAQLADDERAQQTVDEMETSFEMKADAVTYEGLMEAYGRKGKHEKVEMLMAELKGAGLVPTCFCHSVRIGTLVQQFKAAEAVEAVAEMMAAGHRPARELLMQVYRRCQRSGLKWGTDQVAAVVKRIGYRNVAAGEMERRAMIGDILGPGRQQGSSGGSGERRIHPRERGVGGGRNMYENRF